MPVQKKNETAKKETAKKENAKKETPFTAPACKISGLKDARMRLQTVYFPAL